MSLSVKLGKNICVYYVKIKYSFALYDVILSFFTSAIKGTDRTYLRSYPWINDLLFDILLLLLLLTFESVQRANYKSEILRCVLTYSWLSLSRHRLSRITTYLEVKLWPLPKHENLTTGKNIVEIYIFPQYFQYISNFKSPIIYIFVKCGCSNYFVLNSAILICRGTDVSKYSRAPLGIRDNESRLYMDGSYM